MSILESTKKMNRCEDKKRDVQTTYFDHDVGAILPFSDLARMLRGRLLLRDSAEISAGRLSTAWALQRFSAGLVAGFSECSSGGRHSRETYSAGLSASLVVVWALREYLVGIFVGFLKVYGDRGPEKRSRNSRIPLIRTPNSYP